MARFLVVLALFGLAAGMNVDDKARAWLKAHQIPQESDMEVLRDADPSTFAAVRGLLNKAAMGTLGQRNDAAPMPQLTKEQMAEFEESPALRDRKKVLALEANMFKDKQTFAKIAASKATRLSHSLTDTKPKVAKPKPVFRKPAAQQAPERKESVEQEYEEKFASVPVPRKRMSTLATTSSWGDLKKMVKKVKSGKVEQKAAAVFNGPTKGWGTILKDMHKRQQEELTGKNSALSGFSWGDDEAQAKGEEQPKPELSNLSTGFVRVPTSMDMPDQLADFIHSGKKAEPAPVVQQDSLTAGNPYSMDLN